MSENQYANAAAKLATQLERGMITGVEYATELMDIGAKAYNDYSATYTIKTFMDGGYVGGSVKSPMSEVVDLVTCECEISPECDSGCTSTLFLEELKAEGKAVMVARGEDFYGKYVSMTVAYKNA